MNAATYTPEMGERIAALLSEWKLPMVAGELVRRLLAGGHGNALMVVAEVVALEAAGRKERRVERLRRASKLPPGKTFETLDKTRVPRDALLKVLELSRGDFVEQANNVLLFGLPGVGKSHLACALGHALVEAAGACSSTPTYQLVQHLLVARRDLCLPRALRALDVLRVGPDLQDAYGDGGGDRPVGASRRDHRDRPGERAGGGGEEAQRVEEEEGGLRVRGGPRNRARVATVESSEVSLAWREGIWVERARQTKRRASVLGDRSAL